MTVYMCMHFSDGLFCHVKLACTLLHFKMEMFLFLTLNMQKVDHLLPRFYYYTIVMVIVKLVETPSQLLV